MNKVLYILVGAQGSGKTSWAKSKDKDKYIHLQSDTIRKSIFRTLEQQDKKSHVNVFNEMNKRLKDNLMNGSLDIIYDATNMSRKRRKHLYQMAKKYNYTVHIKLFLAPYQELCSRQYDRGEKAVDKEVIKRTYKSFSPPRIGVDCDVYSVEKFNTDILKFIDETFQGIHCTQNSPYHIETIFDHIQLAMINAYKYKDCNDSMRLDLINIAKYHDLGKSICRENNNKNTSAVKWFKSINDGKFDIFYNHENVSSIYYIFFEKSGSIFDNDPILEVIYQHMKYHNNINEKQIKANKLTEYELELLDNFCKIDNISKVAHPMLKEYEVMR